VERFTSQNAPLGIGERPYFRSTPGSYAPGDLLVFLSDGVTEARRADGEMFGIARVVEVIQANQEASTEAMVEALARAIDTFLAGQPRQDDCTCVIARLPGGAPAGA
jgi:sigma-B regulation protein RsbU (phosphoserine phosphatase)